MRNILRKARNRMTGLQHVLPRLQSIETQLHQLMNEMAVAQSKVDQAIASKAKAHQFRDPGPQEAIRILLVVQHPSIWPSWRSFWEACRDDERVVVQVLISPFLHQLGSATVFDDMRECLLQEGVPFYTAEFYDFDIFKPHVVMLQNPYDETRPSFLRIEEIEKKGCRIAYIPYGLEMGGGAANLRWQFNLDLHNRAWRIFARSQRHQKMYGKYCQAGNGHVVVTGHPKFDYNFSGAKPQLDPLLAAKIKGRKVLLWTPHFSVGDPPAWSTFQLYEKVIFEQVRQRPDLFLLIRPHPLFFKEIRGKGIWTEDNEQQFREMIGSSANMALDESSDYQTAFETADALMTDVGSFLLEFLPTGKPLLYLHHPEGLGLNDDSEMVTFLYRASNSEQVSAFIEDVANGKDPKKESRVAVLPEFLFGLDGKAGERVRDHIISALRKGDGGASHLSMRNENQLQSETYWAASSNTFLAPEDYYIRRENALRELVAELPNFNNVIDIGCGDGKFTFLLAEKARDTLGYDISPHLIEKAKQRIVQENRAHIKFEVSEINHIAPYERYDLVSCMGVTSCLVDDLKFLQILEKFKALVKPGGYLLLVDTLSTEKDRVTSDGNGYIAKYRSISDYRHLIMKRGFRLDKEIIVTEDATRKMVNKIFLFAVGGNQ